MGSFSVKPLTLLMILMEQEILMGKTLAKTHGHVCTVHTLHKLIHIIQGQVQMKTCYR